MNIHPTAVVEEGAVIGADVKIGPYALIGPEVKLGDGCIVHGHAVLAGKVTIGKNNTIGYGSVIGTPPQDFAYKEGIPSEVRIGDGNTLREYVTIHRGTRAGSATVMGNNNYLMTASHLGHDVRVGNNVIIANNCLLAGYVEVQDNAVLGGGTVFHQFMRIGRLAMVRGGTRFGKDIPPFTVGESTNRLSGLNAVGLKRHGFSVELRLELKRAFRLLFREGLNFRQGLERAARSEWCKETQEFFDFIAESKRGVCPANQKHSHEESSE